MAGRRPRVKQRRQNCEALSKRSSQSVGQRWTQSACGTDAPGRRLLGPPPTEADRSSALGGGRAGGTPQGPEAEEGGGAQRGRGRWSTARRSGSSVVDHRRCRWGVDRGSGADVPLGPGSGRHFAADAPGPEWGPAASPPATHKHARSAGPRRQLRPRCSSGMRSGRSEMKTGSGSGETQARRLDHAPPGPRSAEPRSGARKGTGHDDEGATPKPSNGGAPSTAGENGLNRQETHVADATTAAPAPTTL